MIPALEWAKGYSWTVFRRDLQAGLTVGVMLVPQAMAYALLAGVPPVYGLYASLIPLAVYTLLGTSRHLAAGIMAIDSLMVIAAAGTVAEPGTDAFITAVVALATMTGLIQLAMGIARFGFLVALLSRPVLAGFASAAALTIGLSQIPALIGAHPAPGRGTLDFFRGLEGILLHLTPWSALIGLSAVLTILMVRRVAKSVPGALVVVVFGTLAVWLFGLDLHVQIVGEVPSGLPTPTFEPISWAMVRRLFPAAVTIALVQFTTVISLGKVFASRHGYRIDANRELIALGAMNFFGSLFRGIPVSGSFSRTAVNEAAGGTTPATNLIAAALVGVTLLFLTPAFHYLPIPVLAAIIVIAAFGMVDVPEIRVLLRTKRIDGLIALITFAVTLLVGIQEGIITGIAASITAVMFRITRPDVVELGHLPETRLFREMDRNPDVRSIDGIYILRFEASFSFVNAEFIREHIISHLDESPDTRALLIDATSINDLDTTAAETLRELSDTLRKRNVRLVFSGVKGRVTDVLAATGLLERIGPENFYYSSHRAVRDILQSWGRSHEYRHTPGSDDDE